MNFPRFYWSLKRVYRLLTGNKSAAARTCLPEGMSVEDFFDRLNSSSVRYAVLHRQDSIKSVVPDWDISLLVDDEYADLVLGMLEKGGNGQPCRVFSVSGLPGTSYRKLPLYPPDLARQVLDEAQLLDGRYRIPSTRYTFLTLAYYCVYELGYRSGIPSANGAGIIHHSERSIRDSIGEALKGTCTRHIKPTLPYLDRLKILAEELQIDCEWTLEGVDAHLEKHGWQPARDKLSRYVRQNPWIHHRFFRAEEALPHSERNLACFVFRDRVVREGHTPTCEQAVREQGFEILLSFPLAGDLQDRVRRNIRGGNWGRGDWPSSGGGPAHLVVVSDPDPEQVPSWLLSKYPLLDNYRIFKAKNSIRKMFNRLQPGKKRHCSCVHVSDNAREAWDYLARAAPDKVQPIRMQLSKLSVSEQKETNGTSYRPPGDYHRPHLIGEKHPYQVRRLREAGH
jgi:hypothetical protein